MSGPVTLVSTTPSLLTSSKQARPTCAYWLPETPTTFVANVSWSPIFSVIEPGADEVGTLLPFTVAIEILAEPDDGALPPPPFPLPPLPANAGTTATPRASTNAKTMRFTLLDMVSNSFATGQEPTGADGLTPCCGRSEGCFCGGADRLVVGRSVIGDRLGRPIPRTGGDGRRPFQPGY